MREEDTWKLKQLYFYPQNICVLGCKTLLLLYVCPCWVACVKRLSPKAHLFLNLMYLCFINESQCNLWDAFLKPTRNIVISEVCFFVFSQQLWQLTNTVNAEGQCCLHNISTGLLRTNRLKAFKNKKHLRLQELWDCIWSHNSTWYQMGKLDTVHFPTVMWSMLQRCLPKAKQEV